ncbi:NLR family CARD domain-containing protein 3 CARD15-like protein Caterpiller protein 16.2 [Channa argus]|uniref:NLR family CARD domain-containing protein 3 CARD15-like protein Caterpiller protein 16.2 n=1 Tax=Channa argus TaxID=215402 RepID=A0A6G1QP46_CHAAH|nr:NLR family CARD domain-containing protein 3 CARD15-like protein Caterpiller protein 16.2 [Channa argus]
MKEMMGTKTEQQSVSVKTKEYQGIQVPSIEAFVEHFHPSFTAQSGGSVVAPSIIGSQIGNLNISITSTGQGCYVSSSEEQINDNVCTQQPQNFKIAECQEKLKVSLKRKFSYLVEGNTSGANKISLNKIYTELYITEGGYGEVNKEHEVRQIEIASRVTVVQENPIDCSHLFVPLPGRDPHIRTVITRGVAGIGKTVSTNKFTLDWAEGTANTHLDFVFPLSFRELNLMRKKMFSFVELLSVFFPETKDTGIMTNGKSKMLFILDGLDESRLSLDFDKSEITSDVTQPTTVAVLLINLIRGRLLPSAFIWITSRPVASSQIPREHIDLVTEVRGFNNPQKDEYFRRKICDENLANRVITHVKSCRSLHIMCHIPVFCLMAASVLEKKLVSDDSKDMPKTLTQMYIHFLSLYVENTNKRLPNRRESNADCTRANLLSLGKLAFKELEKGRLIFYESDLIQNGINVAQASMFSGVYTQIFNEDLTLCKEKTFCFVHLSIQEFFAALYVFLVFHNDNINVLVKKSSVSRRLLFRDSSEVILYKEAVEKALRCENGHYDMFLRFLLGLSMESNHTLLKHLMTSNRTKSRTRAETIKHIKEKIRSLPSTERCLNLFHCLNELNDISLLEEIQSFLGLGSLDEAKLSPAQWATLVFVLLTSEDELSLFVLSNYNRSEDCLLRMLPVLKTAIVAKLNACNLTVTCCEILASGISSSQITDLDLSDNNLADKGIILLSSGLKNSKLKTLRLRSCNLTELSSEAVASVISSASCQLKVLDLTDNDFQDIGVSRISDGLASPHCKLERLNLSLCRVTEEGCTFLASALKSSHLRDLDLSYNHPGNLGLELLSALLDDPQCSLQKLSAEQCGESRIQPGPKKYMKKLTLDPNTAHKDLSLSEGNRRANRWTAQPCPDHPERFDFWRQVLCKEGLTGRCYWETEWSGRAFIGVAYRQMCRKGESHDSWLGRNGFSWGLSCNKDGYKVVHNGMNTAITTPPNSNKVGVYLDWSAGKLSFYRVFCGELTLLHTIHSTFTEPLYPGFQLSWVDSTIYLC